MSTVVVLLHTLVVVVVAGVPIPAVSPNGTSKKPVDYSSVPITKKRLYVPPLQEIADVLSDGLASSFATVSVTVGQTPDLTLPPYYLASPGLSGDVNLLDIGGEGYLRPLVNRDKVYDMRELAVYLSRSTAFIAGASGGDWPYLGYSSEGIVNLNVSPDGVVQRSVMASVFPVGAAKGEDSIMMHRMPPNETRISMMGNFIITDGNWGQAIKVVVKKRTGKSDFITSIRETLAAYYKERTVGLGGTFFLREGRSRIHVQPDFSKTPLCSQADVDNWLHYFDACRMVHVGTLVTSDMDIGLRNQHFHGWSEHGDAGHYHYDVTPQEVQYEGYFVPATTAIRIDPAPVDIDC